MAASPQVRKLRRIRHGLLAVLAVSVLGIGGLYWFGRSGQEPPNPTDGASSTEPGIAVAGEGFDYTLTQGDAKVFRIRGDHVRSDRDDNVELDRVALTFYAEGGKEYTLEGSAAVYNRQSHNAHIEGPVRMSGPGGVALETNALSLDRGGRQLLSNAPVTFQLGEGFHGKARELRASLPREEFVLVGAVEVRGRAEAGLAVVLRAKRVVFERKDRLLRAEGDVELRRGASTVTAQRLSAQISEDEKRLDALQARWDVRASLARGRREPLPADAMLPMAATVVGERLAVLFEAGTSDVGRIELEGDGGSLARLETRDDDGELRRLRAPLVTADLVGGALQSAEASGGTEIEAEDAAGAKRQGRATSAQAFFDPQGNLATVTLAGDVKIDDGAVSARGDRAVLDEAAGKAELFGKDASARNPRGELLAPHIVWTRSTGLVHADGGVRATLEQRADAGATPLGGGGPVQVEAREANWQESPPTYSFVGAVRAWRGDNLLVAEQLRGNDLEGQLSASGGVTATWVPEPEPGAEPEAPLEVQAPSLVYVRGAGQARFSGGVRIARDKRLVTCDEAEVKLAANNRAERMSCRGSVRVDDPPMNRRVEGDRAEYDLVARRITVYGEPVTLSDLERGKAQGRQLVYDLEKGTIRLLSTVEAVEQES